MDIDSATDAVKAEHLPVKENDDSCIFEFTETFLLARDTDGSSTAEYFSEDSSDEVEQENFTLVKQKPDAVCCVTDTVLNIKQQCRFLVTDEAFKTTSVTYYSTTLC